MPKERQMFLTLKFSKMDHQESLRFFQALEEMRKQGKLSDGRKDNWFIRQLDDKQSSGHRVADLEIRWQGHDRPEAKMGQYLPHAVSADDFQQFCDLLGIFPQKNNHPSYMALIDAIERVVVSQDWSNPGEDRAGLGVLEELMSVLKSLPTPPRPAPLHDCLYDIRRKAPGSPWGDAASGRVAGFAIGLGKQWGL